MQRKNLYFTIKRAPRTSGITSGKSFILVFRRCSHSDGKRLNRKKGSVFVLNGFHSVLFHFHTKQSFFVHSALIPLENFFEFTFETCQLLGRPIFQFTRSTLPCCKPESVSLVQSEESDGTITNLYVKFEI